MRVHSPRRITLLAAIVLLACVGGKTILDLRAQGAGNASDASAFEVWIADQSDTRPGFGGQLLIYRGRRPHGRTPRGAAHRRALDLGAETADLCRTSTGSNPVRPHMVLSTDEHTHAVLSFVASGHVVIFDADTASP